MNIINITHSHNQNKITACQKAEHMLDELAQNYGLSIDSDKNGNITFTGSGIKGHVTIDEHNIHITATLGFLMVAMKPVISSEISKKLKETFT